MIWQFDESVCVEADRWFDAREVATTQLGYTPKSWTRIPPSGRYLQITWKGHASNGTLERIVKWKKAPTSAPTSHKTSV